MAVESNERESGNELVGGWSYRFTEKCLGSTFFGAIPRSCKLAMGGVGAQDIKTLKSGHVSDRPQNPKRRGRGGRARPPRRRPRSGCSRRLAAAMGRRHVAAP